MLSAVVSATTVSPAIARTIILLADASGLAALDLRFEILLPMLYSARPGAKFGDLERHGFGLMLRLCPNWWCWGWRNCEKNWKIVFGVEKKIAGANDLISLVAMLHLTKMFS